MAILSLTHDSMPYDFQLQLEEGRKGYEMFCEFLHRRYPKVRVIEADFQEDLGGIDATLILPKGQVWKVQVKTDWKATFTGNIFLETISDERKGTHGLIYKGNPSHLVIILPHEQIAYIANMRRVREVFEREWWKLPRRPVENNGWHTLGVCVPRKNFERCAYARIYDMKEIPADE